MYLVLHKCHEPMEVFIIVHDLRQTQTDYVCSDMVENITRS